jgi:hypothetical protein
VQGPVIEAPVAHLGACLEEYTPDSRARLVSFSSVACGMGPRASRDEVCVVQQQLACMATGVQFVKALGSLCLERRARGLLSGFFDSIGLLQLQPCKGHGCSCRVGLEDGR